MKPTTTTIGTTTTTQPGRCDGDHGDGHHDGGHDEHGKSLRDIRKALHDDNCRDCGSGDGHDHGRDIRRVTDMSCNDHHWPWDMGRPGGRVLRIKARTISTTMPASGPAFGGWLTVLAVLGATAAGSAFALRRRFRA